VRGRPWRGEPNGRQAPRRLLLESRDNAPAARLQGTNELFGIVVPAHVHDEIGIAGQTRLCADRHGETAHQGAPAAELAQVRDDPMERGFGAAQ
jgi:hypothetical protein